MKSFNFRKYHMPIRKEFYEVYDVFSARYGYRNLHQKK